MLQRKLKPMRWIAFSALLSIAACTTPPPDFVACADLIDSLHCATYMTKRKFNVDKTHPYVNMRGEKVEFERVRAGSVLIPSEWVAAIKTHFDFYCHKNGCPNNIGDWNDFFNSVGAQH